MNPFDDCELAGEPVEAGDEVDLDSIPFDPIPRLEPEFEAREGHVVRYFAKIYELPDGMSEISVTRMNSYDIDKMSHVRNPDAPRLQQTQSEKEARDPEESKQVAIRRAKRNVRHKVKALRADHLLTLTYRENMQDVDRLKRDWARFVRMITARFPEWKFVCVKERQERGAFHLHAAVVGRQNVNYLRFCWLSIVGEGAGNIDVRGPRRRWGAGGYQWKPGKLASYLSKYMAKDFDQSEHHSKRYWISKGIELLKAITTWLQATTEAEAMKEARALADFFGMKDIRVWCHPEWKHFWLGGGG